MFFYLKSALYLKTIINISIELENMLEYISVRKSGFYELPHAARRPPSVPTGLWVKICDITCKYRHRCWFFWL